MKILTWNIQWGRGCDGRVDPDRVVSHARRFTDFDVLCLQEVAAGFPELTGGDGIDQFGAIAALLPDFTAIDGAPVDGFGADGARRRFGNMLLSRWPVRQVLRHLLPWPSEPGVKSMQRGAIEATLDTPLGLLRVVCTHLEYHSLTQRMAQVGRLRELHAEAVDHASAATVGGPPAHGPFDGTPRAASAVVVGDFNFRPYSPEYEWLLRPFDPPATTLLDAWCVAYPERPHVPTLGVHDKGQWPGPPLVSDYAFVSADLQSRVRQVQVDAATDASDHQPLLIELT